MIFFLAVSHVSHFLKQVWKKDFPTLEELCVFWYWTYIKCKKTYDILLENVKQLKGHDKGKTLKTIIDHLKAIGYENVQYQVLRAKEFGLPQNRERIYIVGFLDKHIKFTFPKPTYEQQKLVIF